MVSKNNYLIISFAIGHVFFDSVHFKIFGSYQQRWAVVFSGYVAYSGLTLGF